MKYRIACPNGFVVTVAYWGEHHMGAEHVDMTPSVPVAGVRVFTSTNGAGFYDPVVDRLFLHDACLIVEIDPRTLACRHTPRPETEYFGDFERRGDRYRLVLHSGYGTFREVDVLYEEFPWQQGLGPASAGRFPSTFPPLKNE